MSGLFLAITKEEKENILDKHKTVYDGYATNNQQSNMTPLYTQDFANDKDGLQIDHLGNVSKYNNKMYMKESKNVCDECGLYEEVCECGHGQVKGIGGSDEFDYVEEEECTECGGMEEEMNSEYLEDDSVEDDFKEKLQESLDMFKRFKKYN